ncbi:uncharacterized protein LOC130925885 isoform X3 [Corythoichthys intestinalis]|uniref:uncharacterized protein LOC130925885 isoform X3 n=1 Tax=Corythoichthys intestinalis TaxID=161448 RepID=UPI0025A4E9E0|nr:uncharacterized protein LOC130925885 isoform X3 [Corythoichthys intestinalis]
MYDRTNPDWAPTLKLEEMTPTESLKKHAELERKQNRFQRTAKRQETKMRNDAASALLHLQDSCQHTPRSSQSPQTGKVINPCDEKSHFTAREENTLQDHHPIGKKLNHDPQIVVFPCRYRDVTHIQMETTNTVKPTVQTGPMVTT